jgi:hypothetical protein
VWVSIPHLSRSCILHYYLRVPSHLTKEQEIDVGLDLAERGEEPTLVVKLENTSSGFPPRCFQDFWKPNMDLKPINITITEET